MLLELKVQTTGLTIGKVYEKFLPVSDKLVFNVCVYNDEGEPQYVPIKHFKILEDSCTRL